MFTFSIFNQKYKFGNIKLNKFGPENQVFFYFCNISTIQEYPKIKIKKMLKYKYNTILAVRNLQKTGVSFHQVPLASDT